MKVKILSRCEDSSTILVDAKDKAAAEKVARMLQLLPHKPTVRFKTMAGKVAVLSHVARYTTKGAEYELPDEVATCLIHYGLAETVSEAG